MAYNDLTSLVKFTVKGFHLFYCEDDAKIKSLVDISKQSRKKAAKFYPRRPLTHKTKPKPLLS